MAREYKHSGIEWVKQIPSNWNIIKGRHLLFLPNRPVRPTDDVVTCFRDGEVILRSERRTEGFTMSDKEIGYQGINKGDIVIHGMDGFAGAMGVSKSTGKGSPVLIVCNPKENDSPQYIIYYLRSLAMTNVFLALATGIRERSCDLRWKKIAELPFLRPSFLEQQRIANYLDKVCGEVDEMIALQEQMIEELKAYKQSVITEAVTKGLNPNAPMRDSGIDWIGEVPVHWGKDKIIRIFNLIGSGTTPSSSDNEAYEGNLNWIQSGDINGGDLFESKNKISEKTLAKYSALTMYDAPFIIIAMYGASVGNISISHINGCVNQACCVMSKTKQEFKYLFYAIKSAKDYLIYKAVGGGQPNISQSTLKQLWLPIPPLSEQQSIASYLDTKCAEIDALIAIKQAKIEELKDYKKSVIYEYVTGKKEVV